LEHKKSDFLRLTNLKFVTKMEQTHTKCDNCLMLKTSIEIIDCDNCFMNQCVDCLSKQTDYTKCMFCHLSTFKTSATLENHDDVDSDSSNSDNEVEDKPYINNDPYSNMTFNQYTFNPPYTASNSYRFLSSFSQPYSFHNRQEEIDPITNLTEATEKVSLNNNSNSCYVNCIIQIFLHSQELWNSLLTMKKESTQNFLIDIRKQYCDFAGITTFEQCDATLFLNWILDKLENHKEPWSQQWIIMRKCLKCEHKTITKHQQNLWYVYSNEKDEGFTDDDGKKYDCDMAESILNQDQDYIDKKCDECKITTKHKQVSSLQNFPENLFFNFQQFKEKLVYIYPDIDLTVYPVNDPSKDTSASKDPQTKNYILKGFVCHKGTQDFGHYTVYLHDSDGWYHYDDSRRTPVNDIEDILSNFQRFRSFPLLWYTLDETQ
jgi:ubiquitin C-terminal hydrolase